MFRRLLSLGIAVALTAGGCSQSDDAGTEETTSTTITAATTSITVTEATTADPGGPWELLYISDSFGRGVAERYGGIAEEVLG